MTIKESKHNTNVWTKAKHYLTAMLLYCPCFWCHDSTCCFEWKRYFFVQVFFLSVVYIYRWRSSYPERRTEISLIVITTLPYTYLFLSQARIWILMSYGVVFVFCEILFVLLIFAELLTITIWIFFSKLHPLLDNINYYQFRFTITISFDLSILLSLESIINSYAAYLP